MSSPSLSSGHFESIRFGINIVLPEQDSNSQLRCHFTPDYYVGTRVSERGQRETGGKNGDWSVKLSASLGYVPRGLNFFSGPTS